MFTRDPKWIMTINMKHRQLINKIPQAFINKTILVSWGPHCLPHRFTYTHKFSQERQVLNHHTFTFWHQYCLRMHTCQSFFGNISLACCGFSQFCTNLTSSHENLDKRTWCQQNLWTCLFNNEALDNIIFMYFVYSPISKIIVSFTLQK